MVGYPVVDIEGREVIFRERSSVWLTLLMILNAVLASAAFILTLVSATVSIVDAIGPFIAFIYFIIFVFVYSHLRKKGDMNLDRAIFQDLDGNIVEVWKETNIWITIATIFVGLIILVSLLTLVIGYQYALSEGITGAAKGWGSVIIALLSIIYFGIIYAILSFLRTKINFKGDRIKLKTSDSQVIEIYKKRSVWITLGSLVSLIISAILLGSATFTIIQSPINTPTLIEITFVILIGILSFIWAQILSFLSIKGHIRPLRP